MTQIGHETDQLVKFIKFCLSQILDWYVNWREIEFTEFGSLPESSNQDFSGAPGTDYWSQDAALWDYASPGFYP